MKQQSKHFQRLTALLCALALTLALVPAASAAGAAPTASKNIGEQGYEGNWSKIINSYLYPNGQGGLTRVECQTNAQRTVRSLVVEDYNSAFQMVSRRAVALDLPLFGGFFAGSQYNFVVSTQDNLQESDSVEIMRVVKYSKDWQRLGQTSIYAENSHSPISFGTLRFTESNGVLYIHTCHTMYKDKNGINHQSNLTFAIEEATMVYERLRNFYASHSLDQYILADRQGNLVALDLVDSYPFRGVVLQRMSVPVNPDNRWSLSIHDIYGKKGESGTCIAIGGLAETNGSYVTAYTNSWLTPTQMLGINEAVFLIFTDKASQTSKELQINATPGACTPRLVPTGLTGGYVLWNGGGRSFPNDTLYYRTYAENGTVGELKTAKAPMSDCQPILYNGKVVWYVTNDSAPIFYTLDETGVKAVKAAAAPGAAELPAVTKAGVPAPNTPKSSKGMLSALVPAAPVSSSGSGMDFLYTPEGTARANALDKTPCGICGKMATNWVINEDLTRHVCNACYQRDFRAAMQYLDG